MARNTEPGPIGWTCGCMGMVSLGLIALGVADLYVWLGTLSVPVIFGVLALLGAYMERKRRQAAAEESRRWWEELRREEEEQQRQREEQQRKRIEAMLHRDAVRDEINYMTGRQFEKFMADVFRQKGYEVEETRATGDQGVDLILPDLDGKRVVIQLKRWTGPVGNKVVQATFAGMAHYQADEGWIITNSTFTKSARELARSTRVRLIDGEELAEWLEGLREADTPDLNDSSEVRRRRRRRR